MNGINPFAPLFLLASFLVPWTSEASDLLARQKSQHEAAVIHAIELHRTGASSAMMAEALYDITRHEVLRIAYDDERTHPDLTAHLIEVHRIDLTHRNAYHAFVYRIVEQRVLRYAGYSPDPSSQITAVIQSGDGP